MMNKKYILYAILWLCCVGSLSAQSYQIGDLYTAPDGSKGIVYYVHPDGSGGWVVALNDVSTGCAWGEETDVPGLANQAPSYYQQLLNDTAGYANTQALRDYQNNSTTYAAGKVDFAHGWVLPSPAQLSMLYGQLPFITNAITVAGGTALTYDWYWCSAEQGASNAWRVDFGANSYSGHFNSVAKSTSCRVRAVRSFSNMAMVYDTSLTYVWSTGSTQPYINVSPSQTITYTVTATTDYGCSNTAQQTVLVGSGSAQTIYDTICKGAGYDANGFSLTAVETQTAGTLTRMRTMTTSGCSSNITLQLKVNESVAEHVEASACGSYTWNGVTYYESGDYPQTFTAANGCDSVVTLHLTIIPIPELTHTPDTVIHLGDSATLWASGADSPVWMDMAGEQLGVGYTLSVAPSESTTYIVSSFAEGQNLVFNGDFEEGNTGFVTSYIYGNTGSPNHYYIGHDIADMWSWDSPGFPVVDHTSGEGLFLMIDGALQPNTTVWSQTIPVTPHTDYLFSAWLLTNNRAYFKYEINGVQTGIDYSTPEDEWIWERYSQIWNSGNDTVAELKIINRYSEYGGYDYGIDDITFTSVSECSVMDSIRVSVSGYPDNVDSADCTVASLGHDWGIEMDWASAEMVSPLVIPLVGDIDGDEVPEIVCLAPNNTYNYYGSTQVMIFNTITHQLIHTINLPERISTNDAAPYGIIRLPNGHVILVVALLNYTMHAYDLTALGTAPLWSVNTDYYGPNVSFADFNNDSYPEIYIGNKIYDAETGTLLISNPAVTNSASSFAHHNETPFGHSATALSSPCVANLVGDSRPDLILGNEIYEVQITNRNGTEGNSLVLSRSITPPSGVSSDGHPQVADFNLDGYLDVFVSNKIDQYASVGCYVWDVHNNSVSDALIIPVSDSGKSIPLIADVDNDDTLEIVIQCRATFGEKVKCYKYNTAAGGFDFMWDIYVNEDSYSNSMSTFDFNNDGQNDLLISDQTTVRIMNGSGRSHLTGNDTIPIYALTSLSFGECTVMQYPIVVDVDADGSAELLVLGRFGSGHTYQAYLNIFKSAGIPWAPARKVWNQYMYNVTNVNEDLTIPQYLFNNATAFTDPEGVVRRPFNNFLQQATTIDQYGRPFYAVPDVAVESSASSQMTGDTLTLTFSYCNNGDNTLNAPYIITVFANTYGGDTICTATINESLPVDSCTQGEIQLPISVLCGFPNLDSLVVAVNCAGTGIAQNGGQQPECDTTNNTVAVAITMHTDTTHLTASACDFYLWYGDTLMQSGEYMHAQTNANGCDSVEVLNLMVITCSLPDNVDSADCTFLPERTEWGIGEPIISNVGNAVIVSTPMIGDVDDDGQQEIVIPSATDYLASQMNIYNSNGTLKSQFNFVGTYVWNSVGLAKVRWQDNSYKNIIVVFGPDKHLYAYEANGTQLWQSNQPFSSHNGETYLTPAISFADFNHDGWTEVFIGSEVYDAATGVLLCKTDGNKGYSDRSWNWNNAPYQTMAADLCGDSRLELAIGNTVYDVDIQSRTNFSSNHITVARQLSSSAMIMEDGSQIPFADGNTYLADINLDGSLDVVAMNVDGNNRVIYLYVWDVATSTIICSKKITNARKFGTPQIGDLDNDGYSEICFITGTYPDHGTGINDMIYALKYNPSNSNGVMDVFWNMPHDDDSGSTGLTMFDFNQDGYVELVYRDCNNLRIINGSLYDHQTGQPVSQPYNLAYVSCHSSTGIEYPVIADVDLDGEVEIIVGGETYLTGYGHIYIFKSSGEPWAPARKVWNQYMYNVTNVNEDLTIPQYLFNNATAFTDPEGVVRRPFNNFLQQATTIDQYGRPFYAVPDVAVESSASSQMTGDTLTLTFSYCNNGDNTLNAPYIITVFANTYGGDTICTATINESLPVDSCTQGEIQLPISVLCGFPNLDSLVVAVNCAGTGIAQNGGQQPECDTTNNTAAVAVTLHADTTHLNATACDSYLWYGDTLTQSGEYMHAQTNANGCDSMEVLNLTIIPLPELNHTQDTVILAGTSATLWASGADILYWTDGNDSLLSSGNSLTVSPATTTTYYVGGQNLNPALNGNLVVNGDFEAGNVGFGTDYQYITGYNNMYYGRYSITSDGILIWGDDHLYGYGGTGQFMVVDGATSPNSVVWQQTVSVIPNTYYAFSAQVASTLHSNMVSSYALLQFSVNDTQLGDIFHSPDVLNVWQPYYEVWYSGNDTMATLKILNQNNNGAGNDFGLDDISFIPLTECSVTDSIRIVVSGYPDNVMDVDCVFPPDSNAFEMVELFQYPNVNSMSTPMVADMDGDGMPEIIACCYTYSAPYFSSGFHVVNGQTGELKYTISTVQYVNSGQMVTIADVDHDGMSELFLLGRDMKLYCYNYNGDVRWTSANTVDKNYLLSAADVNNDGNVEIVCGRYVYNAQTGVLLLEGNMVETGMGWGVPHGVSLPHHVPYYMYALGDVDNDGTLEVCAGNTVYKMNVNNMSGMTGNSWSVLRQANTPVDIVNKDGQTLLVDFDNDGDFDICVVGVTHTLNNYTSSHTVDVYVWDGQTSQIIAHSPLLVNGHFGASIPYSGDLNGDDFPEIIFAVPDVGMLAYTYDTTTLSMSLMHNHNPFAETSGFTVFDFNQDGRNEIVYRGTSQLFIVDGITLDNLCEPITAYSGTITEYPVVADVNADGHAEIIVTRAYNSWSSGNANGWVSVYGSQIPGAWSSARKVWNQWAYNSVNINEDMTVPQYRFDVSTTFPNGKKPFNSFLRQMPYIDSQGDLFNAVADVAVSEANAVVQNDTVLLSLSYCNTGDNALFAPYNIAIFANAYGGDTICTATINESLPVDSCTQGEIRLPISVLCGFPNLDSLVVAVNCAGTGIAQNGGQQPECDTTNNTASVVITIQADTTHLTATACDSYIWYGDTLTQSGEYTHTQVNPDGCDSVMILHLLVKPSSDSTLFATVVENNLPYILNDSSYMLSGVYDQHFINAVNCDSTLTLHLTVYHNQTYEVDSTVCEDALPLTWNDSVFTEAGTKTRIYLAANGADSIVVMTLQVNPLPTAAISGPTVLCGDSVVTLTADSAYTYLWSTGDTTRSIAVTEEGIYTLTVTNEFGCEAVATHPLMPLGNPILSVSVPTMCAGGSYNLSVGYQPGDNIHLGHGETTLSMTDTIFLPDGIYCEPYGCSYRSPLTFTAYADGDTIQSVEDIYYVKLNIEHSWIGDLYINITCPNGQKADLMKYGGSGTSDCSEQIVQSSRGWAAGSNMPYSTYLGDAYDYNVGSCDASAFGNEPGVGWNYCWSENTSQGYIYASGTGGYIYRLGNTHNNIVDSSNVSAGTQFYHPDDSFSNLIGCPLNGDWYIEVQDGWSGDNGYIFGWELALSSEALPDAEFELNYSTADGPWVTTLSDTLFQITPPEGLEHDTTVAYTFTVYDTVGCGYDTTVNITFYAVRHTEVDTAVCESYTWNGSVYTESGQYEQTFTSAVGCDSIVTLQLTVYYNQTYEVDSTVCEDALPLTWNDSVFTEAGTKTRVYPDANGCDSIVVMTLNVLPSPDVVITGPSTLCADSTATLTASVAVSYLWSTGDTTQSVTVTDEGTYTVTVTDATGCVSSASHLLLMMENPIMSVNIPEMCAGGSYTVSVGHQGDDNIVLGRGETTLSMVNTIFLPDGQPCNDGVEMSDQLEYCSYVSPVTFTSFASSSMIQSANNIWYVRIKMEHSFVGDLWIKLTCPNNQYVSILRKNSSGSSDCSGQIPASEWGWLGGGVNGADFGVVGSSNSSPKCDPDVNPMGTPWNYVWSNNTNNGYQYFSEDYVYGSSNVHNGRMDSTNVAQMTNVFHPEGSFANLIGCPMNGTWSIEVLDGWSGDNGWITEWEIALDPALLPDMEFVFDHSIAEGPWVTTLSDSLFQITPPADLDHDTTVAYTFTVYDTVGCGYDTTVNITFYAVRHTEVDTAVCESYTWNGSVYTESGEYEQTFTSAVGCDSIVTLHLTVNHKTYGDTTVVACESYTWHGVEYTATPAEAPKYTMIGGNHNGCDSVVTLHLTVNHKTYGDTTVVACESYTWHGVEYTATPAEAPTYTMIGGNHSGCDSVVTLHLTVVPTPVRADTLRIMRAWLPYNFPVADTVFAADIPDSSSFVWWASVADGCDTMVMQTVLVYPEISITASGTINTDCESRNCFYNGPTIMINEVMLAPQEYDGSMVGSQYHTTGGGEWIELYNPHKCDSVDISCYFLGNNAYDNTNLSGNWPGGFVIPPGSVVPPQGFAMVRGALAAPVPSELLVQNGGNVVEIVIDSRYCLGEGGGRLWFPNAGGWFAFYDADGVPQDAISWNSITNSCMSCSPCVPSVNDCGFTGDLVSYDSIPADRKNYITGLDPNNYRDLSFRRIPDGGEWQSVPSSPTYGTCNAECVEPAENTGNAIAVAGVAGGVPPYTYQWDDPAAQTSDTAFSLSAGVYTVTVTDFLGNTVTATVSIQNFVPEVSHEDGFFCLSDTMSVLQGFPAGGIYDGTVMSGDTLFFEEGVSLYQMTYTIADSNGCTATDTFQVTVAQNVFPADSTVCSVELPILWYGDTLTLSGDYTHTQVNPDGCDSVMILHLLVKPSSDSTLFATVVENNLPYILNDSSYMLSGVYDQHFINAVNCDSTLTLHLTVYHNQTYEVDSTVCEDALPLTWNDSVFTEAGTKTRIYLAANGADSIVVMTLQVNPLPTAAISGPTVLCGDSVVTLTADSAYSYLWSTGDTTRSIAVTEEGVYSLTVTSEFGCGAEATHPLMPLGNPILSVTVPEMCAGGSYTLSVGYQPGDNIHLGHGETTLSMTDTIFLPDGIYCEPHGCSYRSPLTFTAYADGDTIQSVEDIYYVKLNIEHSWIGDLYINITCPNGQKADLMKYGGSGTSDCNSQIEASSRGWAAGTNMSVGTYLGAAYYYNAGSCDASAFGNEPGVGWNYCWSENTTQGYTYAPGTGSLIYRSEHAHGGIVDSSNVSAGTQFYHPDDSFSNLIGCPLNGDWYIEVQDGWSGDNGYIFGWELALSSEALPDMEYELDYSTVEGPWVTILSDTLFQITPPEGLEHDTVIAYTFTVYDTVGCGYDTTVNITFYAIRHTEVDTAVCETFTWNGSVYTESGQYEQTFTSAVGCDSIVTLHLTVNHKTYGDTTVVACESYTWHGVEYTSTPAVPPTYTMPGGNHNGCDSIVTLHLTVNHKTYGDTTAVACESYTWHGVEYTTTPAEAPTYTMTGGNHSGCDSIVTLHLTVNHKTYGDTTVVACEHFTWHGVDYTETPAVAPTYTMIGGNHSGCDSIVTLQLTVNHGTHDVSEETVCEGYEWHGETYTESDTYTYAYTNANGCPSVDTLHLTVHYGTHNVTDTAVCENCEWHGTAYTESGTYTYAYTNADDCPSADTLHLTVSPVYEFSFEDVICEGEVYSGHGFVVPSSQTVGVPDVSLTQSLQSQSGCDSLVHLTLTVIDTSLRIVPLTEDFCESSSMELMVETSMEDYVWSTGEGAPTITVMEAGIYSVTATQGGCQATAHINVEECHYELYLPNAITPSRGDGLNDYFSIPEVNRANMVMFEIAIYNRWGELVFYSKDKNFKWNGEYRGQIYYETIYNYVIRYTDTAGKPYVRTGSITIL